MFTVKFLKDLAERSVWTFVQGWAAAWVVLEGASPDEFFSTAVVKIAALAGIIAVAKAIGATQIGANDSAATLPE